MRHQLTLTKPDQFRPVSDSTLFDWKTSGIALPGEWSIRQRVLHGGVSEGVHVVDVCNGPLTVCVLPTRGMGVWNAELDGIPVGWNSPVKQPVHPQHVDLHGRNGLGWLEGFNELLCRCGLASVGPPGLDDGAVSPVESQLTLHGRIANTPAHTVEVGVDPEARTLWIRGMCDEACLFGPHLRLTSLLTLHAGERFFTVRDEVQNLGASDTDLELLYHINVGPPFLGEGSRVECSFAEMSPRDARAAEDIESFATYLGPTPGYAEQVYLFDPRGDADGHCTALLRNATGDRGFSVAFDTRQLPCFTLWKCTQPEADGYVTGLEPGTNFPNFKAIERRQGRVRRLAAGESYVAELTIGVHDSAEAVAETSQDIERMQTGREPRIHSQPTEPFTIPC
ncbi:MAG: aldose 1-epimerase family protein [Planctomycetaceae bacterium]